MSFLTGPAGRADVPYVPGPTPDPIGPPESTQAEVPVIRPKKRALWPLFLIAGVVAVAAAAGAAVYANRGSAMPVSGTLTLVGGGLGNPGDICTGHDGYSDILGGTGVTVSDATGATIALGRLDSGRIGGGNCNFTFEVADVPTGKRFYGIEISHRGVVKYPEQDLFSHTVELHLG